jgi:hypothetical protein
MIYEIISSEVYNAAQVGASFIVNSADGYRSLVSSLTAPDGIDIINVYEDTSLRNLMNSPDWKQPCIDC